MKKRDAEQQKIREECAKRAPLKLTSGRIDRGAMQTMSAIEGALASLAQELYAKPQPDGTLSRGEREILGIVAAAVSGSLRSMDLHAACAFELLAKEKPDRTSLVHAVMADDFTPLHDKLRPLAEMVKTVALEPRSLTQEHIDKALKVGATGTDIVLALTIGCAEAVFSGRMEAMRVPMHANPGNYRTAARDIARNGYRAADASAPAVVRQPDPE